MEIFNYYISPSRNPPAHEMLQYDYWELHEAAYQLTEWPKYIAKVQFENAAKKSNLSRTFFYQPCCKSEENCIFVGDAQLMFDAKEMGVNFSKVLVKLKNAINSGSLSIRSETLHVGEIYQETTSTLLFSKQIIEWALLNGIALPEDLQKAIGIHVINGKFEKSDRNKVKNKIVGQFLWEQNVKIEIAEILEHPWMFKYGSASSSRDKTLQVIYDALNDLWNQKKVGRPSKESRNNIIYNPQPIKEVIHKEKGILHYHIPSLKLAMETAATILLDKVLASNTSITTLHHFLNYFMENNVVNLYTKNAPSLIKELVQTFASNIGFNIFINKELSEKGRWSVQFRQQ